MEKDTKKLSSEELEAANGGNYGDSEEECDGYSSYVKFMYDVGDVVEVFTSKIHIWTRRGKIVKRYAYRDVYDGWGAYYDVQYLDDGYISTMVQADDIERK